MKFSSRPAVILAVGALLAALAGCGSDDDDSSSSSKSSATSAPVASDLGTPKKATGEPVQIGMINQGAGAVAFPQVPQAAEAAVEYVNNYLGGINGRPIKLDVCTSDGQPATSARCANQLTDKKPVLILGGADTGGAGSFGVFERTKPAFVGGVPFTPVESNAENARIFISLVVADNAAAVKYAKDEWDVKKASIIFTDVTQGQHTADIVSNVMESLGIEVQEVPVGASAADFSAPAASAIGSNPDMIYVVSPNACAGVLKALQGVGYKGHLQGIDSCTGPPVLKAAGDAVEGLVFAAPFESLDAGSDEGKITAAALEKYAPADIALDTPAVASFASVMNIHKTLSELPESEWTSEGILGAITEGEDHENWLAHPYTCDRKQVPSQAASCNGYQKIKQVKDGKVVTISDDWVDGAQYYKPPPD